MRIWDINPGYLNRQSLLGEHRELHGIVSIIKNHKKGYSNHPETLRWMGYGWALRQRHRLLAAEMWLRGYTDHSPVNLRSNVEQWPETFIDPPHLQFELLKHKYSGKDNGRIPLPKTTQDLWRQHKYSVLARDQALYKKFDGMILGGATDHDFSVLAKQLTLILRQRPSPEGISFSLANMWESVFGLYSGNKPNTNNWTSKRMLKETQRLATSYEETDLIRSTALSELGSWM